MKYIVILFILTLVPALRPCALAARADQSGVAGQAGASGVADTSGGGTVLDTLIAEVLAKNPRLAAARHMAHGAATRPDQAGAWEDPLAGVEFFATPITSANPFKDGLETDYFLQQTIPWPGKKGRMSDAAAAAARVSAEGARAIERNIVAETKRSYAMLWSAQRRIDVNERNRVLVRQIVESARSRYRVGEGGQSDVLKVQLEDARLQNERSVLDQELASASAMMNALRAAPQGTPIGRVAEIEPRPVIDPVDTLCARALAARPELLSMAGEIEMNGSELAAAKKEWYPDIMVKGTYKDMKDMTDQWAAMIGVTIPVAPWGIGKYSGRVEENEARLMASEQSLADMRNMVVSEVRGAHAKVRSAWERLERYRTTLLPQAEQAYGSTLGAYENSTADFLSLLDGFRTLQMLRMEYTMVVEEYETNVAALERAVGGELR